MYYIYCRRNLELELLGVDTKENPSKIRGMPLSMESTRYSLVKGERIVRSVLTTRLHGFRNGRYVLLYRDEG